MLTTIEGVYQGGKIELSEKPVGIEQAPVIVTFLSHPAPPTAPLALYGVWKDRVAPDFDIDIALSQIRGEHTVEWNSMCAD